MPRSLYVREESTLPWMELVISTLLDKTWTATPSSSLSMSPGGRSALQALVIKQLRYMSSHFGIRNAALIGRIIELGTDDNL
jgi:hypothetical protein